MKIKLLPLVNIALFLTIAAILVFKFYAMEKEMDDIDYLEKEVKPLQAFIKPGSRVGFRAVPDSKALFAATRYAMAPFLIVNDARLDSLIFIQKASDKPVSPAQFTICAISKGKFVISLISRKD